MKLEQLSALTEDETAMLWGIVNLATPPVINAYQMDVELFTAIKDEKLKQRGEGKYLRRFFALRKVFKMSSPSNTNSVYSSSVYVNLESGLLFSF